jgi:hypothetical protein
VFLILDNRFWWLTKSKYPLMSRVSAIVTSPLLCVFWMSCVSVSAALSHPDLDLDM